MSKKRNRSDSYQYRMVEIAVDPAILSDFSIDDGFNEQMKIAGHSEDILDLRQELIKELYRLINEILTERQSEVLNLRLKNYTQTEIAETLGIHQTTVHKTLSGNIDYKNGEARYGGALKKLKKACSKDHRVKEIISKIKEIRLDEYESICWWL